ncbi:MAG: Rpn family recombination-promoting nuclease/putative transposase [Vallitaleaceae bacterium]|nr:Rpn family recombination-promoting nuclease/putative transposase [Vallitaleaceae bacterium]
MQGVDSIQGSTKKENEILLSIQNDMVFKAVFGRDNEKCKIILADLLNSILDLKGHQRIQELVYQNPFNLQSIPTDKLSIMDIKVQTGTGEWIDIEMQMSAANEYRKRSLYYWANLYKDSLSSAENFQKLKKCIVINITGNKCIQESNCYHTHFQILESTEHFILTDHLSMHFIALASFDDTKPVEEMSEVEEWVLFLKDSDNPEKSDMMKDIVRRKEAIKMANEVLEEIKADQQMREMVLAVEKARRDQLTREYDAREEGINIGIVTVLNIQKALKAQMKTEDILKEYNVSLAQLEEIQKNL